MCRPPQRKAPCSASGLTSHADDIAATLSHGAKRQLEIAMCLATAPQILLLDEPLAGMGSEETERMLMLVNDLKASHAILLVEHDMDAVFRVSDRITVMVNGRVLASGTPSAIRANAEVQEAYLGAHLDEGDLALSANAPAPLIDAAQLHTHYGASHILHGASLTIGAGEAVGLLGRNGMGKTTLIRTLLGLVRPTSGAIRIRGTDCTRRTARSHRTARDRLRARRSRHFSEPVGA